MTDATPESDDDRLIEDLRNAGTYEERWDLLADLDPDADR